MTPPSTHARDYINYIPDNRSALPRNLLVFSHLRWDFVYQRPQHLLTRFAQEFNVLFLEEPVFDDIGDGHYSFSPRGEGITVMVLHLPPGLSTEEILRRQKTMFDGFIQKKPLDDFAFWYYTPMALEFSRAYKPKVVIFDCMDELSAFKFAPENLKLLEKELLSIANVVFTGGRSLYEAKKHQHANIHAFPSSIDNEHFLKARTLKQTSSNAIGTPVKLGFFGVIDERFDIELIREIADKRPLWEIELVGPVVKIDPATLPVRSNINYAGSKSYQELPVFLATWDMALIPFLLNDSTRFISPTKTPEYLAGGLPVVSTPIKDVIDPYGLMGLVHIAGSADGFIAAIEKELQMSVKERETALQKADEFLALNSWDLTCAQMLDQLAGVLKPKPTVTLTRDYV